MNCHILRILLFLPIFLVAHSCSADGDARDKSENNGSSNVESLPSPNSELTDIDLVRSPSIIEALSNKDWKTSSVEIIRGDSGEMTTKDMLQGRDMAAYHEGGYFECQSNRWNDCGREKARDFIWDCWTKQQRGYVRLGWSGIDVAGTTHIFIEPNDLDQWSAVIREVQINVSMETNLLTETIGRVKVARSGLETTRGNETLNFRNNDNKTIRTF